VVESANSEERNISPSGLNGLVLAGGFSRRMGVDKSLLVYHGKPQREYLSELLKKYCSKVFVSCRKEQHVPPGLNPLIDSLSIAGPLNGILSAFQHEKTSWLTVAVDMPYVDETAIQMLIKGRDVKKMATCFFNKDTQQPEPLLTLWERDAHAHLLAFVEKGNISPRDFLKTHPIKMIDPPHGKTLLNFNSSDDIGGKKT
jgi:molybdopterin-guanine dinucleotide biosynthesis protein A